MNSFLNRRWMIRCDQDLPAVKGTQTLEHRTDYVLVNAFDGRDFGVDNMKNGRPYSEELSKEGSEQDVRMEEAAAIGELLKQLGNTVGETDRAALEKRLDAIPAQGKTERRRIRERTDGICPNCLQAVRLI